MAAADTARLIATLELGKNTLSSGIDKALRSVDKLEGRLSKVGSRAGEGIGTAAANIAKAGKILGAAGIGIGIGSVKVAADFEAQLRTINTVARQTPDELNKIGDGIRAIARESGTPLDELTQGFYDLVSAGVAANQAQQVLASSNRLAVGGLASAAEGVDLITTALNSYGVSAQNQGKESERFADVFAKAIERGKVTAADLAGSFAQIGGIAANNGIEIEELAASYAQLTSKGVPAAEATTNIRSALLALIRRTGDLEKLEKATGKSYLAIAGKKGLVSALEELRVDSAKTGKPMIDFLGRVEGLNFAVSTTGASFAGYNANLREMQDATGTAAEQMGERQQGLTFQLGKLQAILKDTGITLGTATLPALTALTDRVSTFVSTNQGAIEEFATNAGDALAGFIAKVGDVGSKVDWDAVGAAVSGIATSLSKVAASAGPAALEALKSVPWASIGEAMELAGAGAKAALDTFRQMPDWLKTAIITGWGLNKLTGGALSGIVGELGKGLVHGVLGMNAGVVNINAGAVRGGGLPAGPAGAAGAASKGLSGLSKVFLVGEAIGLGLLVNEVRVGLGNQATAQAAAINDTATRWINNNNVTSADLRTGIDAVNTGISELQSNPLLTLVQGEALTQLQETKRLLQEQLTAITNPPVTAHDSDKELGSAADALKIAAAAMKSVNADAAHFKGQQTAFETRDRELPPDITKVPIKLPDYAHDLTKLPEIASAQREMRTEFIADRQANQTGNVILARAHGAIQTLTNTTSIVTGNVQAAVQSATAIAHNDAANLVAAVRAISVAPPTINVPRAPTPVVNVNISNRSVTSAVSRNTTFTRPV